MTRTKRPLDERLRDTDLDEGSGCHLWRLSCKADGYGLIRVNSVYLMVHRVAYEQWVGPIPTGFEVDHVRRRGCKHRNCINPDHLEAVTRQENRARVIQGCQKPDHKRRDIWVKGRPARRCVTCQTLWQKAKRAEAS